MVPAMPDPAPGRRTSLASDSVYNALSFVLRAFGTVAGMAWVARVLGPELQGKFGFAHWAGSALAQVTLLGLAPTTARFLARALGADDPGRGAGIVRTTGRWLLVQIAVAVPVAVLCAHLWGGELRIALMVAALYPLFMSTYLWRVAVAWGLRRFDVDLMGHVVFFAVLLPGFWLGLNSEHRVVGVLLATLVARGAHLGAVWWWTRHLEAPAEVAPVERKEVRSYAWDMAAVTLVTALLWERSELIVLKAYAPWSDLGLYTAAYGISALVIRVPSILATVLIPFVAELQGQERHAAVGEAFGRGARLLTLALAGPTMVACLAAPSLVHVVYGEDYAGAVVPLQILLLPLLFGGFGGAASKTMIGGGAARLLLKVESVGLLAKLGLALLLVPQFGAAGAAMACAVGQGGSLAGAGIVAGRRFGAVGGGWEPQIVIIAACAGAAWAASTIDAAPLLMLAMQVGAGAVAWIGGAVLLRPLKPGDTPTRWAVLGRLEQQA